MPVPDTVKFNVVRAIREAFRQRFPIIDVDGVRVIFPEGWGLVRASNTQPALVLRIEARSEAALERIKREIETMLARFPEVEQPAW